MQASVIEFGGMVSALSAHGVEKRLSKLRGVRGSPRRLARPGGNERQDARSRRRSDMTPLR